jgi:hypothetical protein
MMFCSVPEEVNYEDWYWPAGLSMACRTGSRSADHRRVRTCADRGAPAYSYARARRRRC